MFLFRFVGLSAGLLRNYRPDFPETWWKGAAQAKEEPIKFWSGSKLWLFGPSIYPFSYFFDILDSI